MIRTGLRYLKYNLNGNAVYWSNGRTRNWGDDINPWLYREITGRNAVYCPHQDVPRLFMAGSILDRAGPFDSCWGTGFISNSPNENRSQLREAYATRGPLTAEILEKSGVSVSHIYGDPGIIAARCIMAELDPVEKHNQIGIVPHYVDVKTAYRLALEMRINAQIIETSLPRKKFVAEILKCSYVLSSSLHGLVVAESIGVPSAWLRLSDKVVGGAFKFADYVLGTDRKRTDLIMYDSLYISEISSPSQITPLPAFNAREIANRLLAVFPRARVLRSV